VIQLAALAGAMLLVLPACTERQESPSAVDRLVDENHKAAEALVQAAREAAAAAGEQAQAARDPYEGTAGSEPGTR
jgi:hypothetical protein